MCYVYICMCTYTYVSMYACILTPHAAFQRTRPATAQTNIGCPVAYVRSSHACTRTRIQTATYLHKRPPIICSRCFLLSLVGMCHVLYECMHACMHACMHVFDMCLFMCVCGFWKTCTHIMYPYTSRYLQRETCFE